MNNSNRRSRWLCRLGVLASFTAMSCLALAADGETSDAVMDKLAICVACHGADGIGKAPQYPNLAGQKAAYLEKQLRAFKSGELKNPDMNVMAASLSDDDIVALSAYFSSLQ